MVNVEKITLTAFTGILFAWCDFIIVPIIVLVSLNLIDYATGLLSAKYRGQKITSKKSMQGIIKKVTHWLLVIVGFIIDIVIALLGSNVFGGWVCGIVCIWLSINEIISILENSAIMGVKYPNFLKSIVEKLAKNIDEGGEK